MRSIASFVVFFTALAWKWLSYMALYPAEGFRAISLALAGLVVPFMLLSSWYLALFVLGRAGLNFDNLKFRLLELLWVAIVLGRLRNPIIEGGQLTATVDGIFLFLLFAFLIVFRRWMIDDFNKIFEYYEENILIEFGLNHNSPANLSPVKTRITMFLLGALILAFIF